MHTYTEEKYASTLGDYRLEKGRLQRDGPLTAKAMRPEDEAICFVGDVAEIGDQRADDGDVDNEYGNENPTTALESDEHQVLGGAEIEADDFKANFPLKIWKIL